MMMLVGPRGRERTAKEYGTLLSKAGLRLTRVVPTESAVSVTEAKVDESAGGETPSLAFNTAEVTAFQVTQCFLLW